VTLKEWVNVFCLYVFQSAAVCAALVGESIQMYIKKLGKIKRKKGNKNFFTILKLKKLKEQPKNKKEKQAGTGREVEPSPITSAKLTKSH